MKSRSLQRAGSRGFTLIELMISVALGMLLMVALVAVYLNISRTNSEMAKTNSLIENGRFAIDVVGEDLSHVGFWGGFVPDFDNFILRTVPPDPALNPTDPAQLPSDAALALGPCLAYASWTIPYKATIIGAPIEAYDGVPPGCSTMVSNRKANTDVLVVRHLENCVLGTANCHCAPGDATCYDNSLGAVYFQASFCREETAANFKYVLSSAAADFTLKQRGCTGTPPATVGTAAAIRRLVTNIYYVRTYSTDTGDGIPTLMRATFTNGVMGGPVALIEGIESFKVELGLDAQNRCGPTNVNYTVAIASGATGNMVRPSTCTYDAVTATNNIIPTVRGDGIPESYMRCPSGGCTAAQLMNVVAVKLYVLARTLDASTASGHADTKTYTLGTSTITPTDYNPSYKRHVFQTTARLHNVSGRRETPMTP